MAAEHRRASDRRLGARREIARPVQATTSRRALRRRSLIVAIAPFAINAADAWRRRHTRSTLIVHGVLDESAHLLTGLVVIESLFSQRSRAFQAALLVSSVLIDVDHLPAYNGHRWLDRNVARPYPHSLTTLATIFLFARARSAKNDVSYGVLAGTALHFWRDVSEPGTGIPLFWPISKRTFSVANRTYAAALTVLGIQAAVRLSLAGQYSEQETDREGEWATRLSKAGRRCLIAATRMPSDD